MKARGFSLIELTVAMGVSILAIAAVMMVITSAATLSGNAEQRADGDNAARFAAEGLVRSLREAGLGASGGIYIGSGGSPVRINAVFGRDGTGWGGSDELWMVLPDRNAFGESCVDSGAATTITTAALSGPITVGCVDSFKAGQMLVATDMTSAALLTNVQVAGQVIDYAESGIAGFADSAGGYKQTDWVFGASVWHYFLALDAQNQPALYRSAAVLGAGAGGVPFVDTGDPILVASRIEDLQLAYGIDAAASQDPANYAYQNGLNASFTPGVRSVRLSLVSVTGKKIRNNQVQTSTASDLRALTTVENHVRNPVAPLDGLRRSLYQQRVELPNMATGVL